MKSLMKPTLLASVLLSAATFTYAAGFQLSSPDIKAGGLMAQRFEFNGFGCSGENRSPALQWSGAPLAPRWRSPPTPRLRSAAT